MKICLIIDDYVPQSIKVGAKMMHELGMEFVNLGHEVTVITPAPDLNTASEIIELDNITICRFRSGKIKNTSKVKRAANESLLSFYAWRAYKNYFKNNPHDLIVYYSPTIFFGSLVEKLKKIWGASSYLILRDFFPQWVIDGGLLSANSPIATYFRYFEQLNYRAADTIAIQSPKNLEWFSQTTNIQKPLELLFNWASDEPVDKRNSYYRQQLGLEEKVVYFYGGNIGHAQDMMNIVRLARAMSDEDGAHFVLVGDGDEVELVRKAIEKYCLNNMTLLPSISQSEFKRMLAEFDIGLFSLHRDHVTHNFPGKLLGYMLQEKPILGSVNPGNDLKSVVEDAGAGFVTINGDDEGLYSHALTLFRDISLRKMMGKNARKLLQKTFSVETAAQQILTTKNSLSVKETMDLSV